MANVLWTSMLYGRMFPYPYLGGLTKQVKQASSTELVIDFYSESDLENPEATIVITGKGLSRNLNSGTVDSLTVFGAERQLYGLFDELNVAFNPLWEAVNWEDNDNPFSDIVLGGNDVITGTWRDDTINGNAGHDRILGGSGDDFLIGYTGRDTVEGGSGDDYLIGGSDDDVLKGSAGNDRLEGGSGADKLYGGSGADSFVFESTKDSTTSAKRRDTIFDFKQTQKDKIDLTKIDANTKSGGDQAFKFIGTDGFHKKAGELRYEKKQGDTFVFTDVNGDGKADFSIVLDSSVNLKASDFIL
ncbi:Ca2+-binding RTX toxin-like protein [Shinella sp. BE166]|uniref:M10 family metallopeptidase C-terminal domain-containing protein n=1 Tax=Shinella sp. BE166 TaxID=3373918 RepID=UPI003EB8C2DB